MSIVYCDYLVGDDATGSGTSALPYKTITQASTSLTGGDEVRVAKSTAITTLSGTLAWVDGSASITTSEDLTGQLSQGDFVGKDTAGETWWEAITITDTTLTLYKKYSGTTETVSSKKLGITSTGAAAASATQVQVISSSGSSVGNELKISGGWDLSTETQDGQTYFRQMHGTFTTRYGTGLYATGKSYVEIERLHFLRYNLGIQLYSNSNYNIITSATCNSNGHSGIHLYNANNTTVTSPTCNCNSYGLNIYSSDDCDLTSVICNCNSYGLNIYSSDNHTITTATCNRCSTHGCYLQTANSNTITSITCNNNTQYGIYIYSGSTNTFTTPICNDNTKDGIRITYPRNTLITPTCNGNDDSGIYTNYYLTTITTPTCNNNSDYGIYLYTANNSTITTPTCNNNNKSGLYIYNMYVPIQIPNVTCNDNSQYGVYSNTSFVTINNYSGTGNSIKDFNISVAWCIDIPRLKVQHFNAVGDNRCYYEYGVTYRDTADAQSGECLKFDPSSDTYYCRQNFYFRAASGVAQTLSAYVKDDAAFNGDIQAAIYFMGVNITGWTAWTPTTSYVKHSLVAAAGDISEDGVLELAIKVRSTAGNVFVDSLETA